MLATYCRFTTRDAADENVTLIYADLRKMLSSPRFDLYMTYRCSAYFFPIFCLCRLRWSPRFAFCCAGPLVLPSTKCCGVAVPQHMLALPVAAAHLDWTGLASWIQKRVVTQLDSPAALYKLAAFPAKAEVLLRFTARPLRCRGCAASAASRHPLVHTAGARDAIYKDSATPAWTAGGERVVAHPDSPDAIYKDSAVFPAKGRGSSGGAMKSRMVKGGVAASGWQYAVTPPASPRLAPLSLRHCTTTFLPLPCLPRVSASESRGVSTDSKEFELAYTRAKRNIECGNYLSREMSFDSSSSHSSSLHSSSSRHMASSRAQMDQDDTILLLAVVGGGLGDARARLLQLTGGKSARGLALRLQGAGQLYYETRSTRSCAWWRRASLWSGWRRHSGAAGGERVWVAHPDSPGAIYKDTPPLPPPRGQAEEIQDWTSKVKIMIPSSLWPPLSSLEWERRVSECYYHNTKTLSYVEGYY
ncbi:unnamed protein product [Closterium sp. Yama58-4]|nr:unnamed protein product [Closterium sp. Yama58-4]